MKLNSRTKRLDGQIFNRLKVVSFAGYRRHHAQWNCECSCGNSATTRASRLLAGDVQSCGCLQIERATAANTKHGHWANGKPSATLNSWNCMRSRCTYEKDKDYHNYGGRGITVCERWMNTFENFLEDMGDRPEGKTLDRINSDGNYEPSNCRWATPLEQTRNRTRKEIVDA